MLKLIQSPNGKKLRIPIMAKSLPTAPTPRPLDVDPIDRFIASQKRKLLFVAIVLVLWGIGFYVAHRFHWLG
jgi:hypothetical protein